MGRHKRTISACSAASSHTRESEWTWVGSEGTVVRNCRNTDVARFFTTEDYPGGIWLRKADASHERDSCLKTATYPAGIKMNITPCPNFNHRETNPPVRVCPNCGKVVNERIPAKQCSEQSHSSGGWTETSTALIAASSS